MSDKLAHQPSRAQLLDKLNIQLQAQRKLRTQIPSDQDLQGYTDEALVPEDCAECAGTNQDFTE